MNRSVVVIKYERRPEREGWHAATSQPSLYRTLREWVRNPRNSLGAFKALRSLSASLFKPSKQSSSVCTPVHRLSPLSAGADRGTTSIAASDTHGCSEEKMSCVTSLLTGTTKCL